MLAEIYKTYEVRITCNFDVSVTGAAWFKRGMLDAVHLSWEMCHIRLLQ